MAQKIRLVAYRNDISYPLDLLDNPNVSLNFKFSDIKNPASKQSSYSQTFKLPFTDNNNAFFQDWHNSNVTEIANGFSTNKENLASLFVNEIEQFVGTIILKGTYNKAKYYDVLLLTEVANLFTTMGSKSVKDSFINYTTLNHTLTETNIQASWNNTMGADFQDTVGLCSKIVYPIQSYSQPLLWTDNDYLNNDGSLTDFSVYDEELGSNITINGFSPHKIRLESQKPAIQLRTVLERIFATNGFTWTSTFLDSVYFRRLYMTTCNFMSDANSQPPFANSDSAYAPTMFGQFGYTDMRCILWKAYAGVSSPEQCSDAFNLNTPSTQTYANVDWSDSYVAGTTNATYGGLTVNADATINPDSAGFLTIPTYHDIGELSIQVDTNLSVICETDGSNKLQTPLDASSNSSVLFQNTPETFVGLKVSIIDENDNEIGSNVDGNNGIIKLVAGKPQALNTYAGQVASGFPFNDIRNNLSTTSGSAYQSDFQNISVVITNNLAEIPIDTKIRLKFCPVVTTMNNIQFPNSIAYLNRNIATNQPIFLIGKPSSYIGTVNGVDCTTRITVFGNTLDQLNTYGLEVSVPNCIDPSLSQKGMLKDLSDRFNLVIQQDPNSSSNLLIEPMTDFLASGGDTKFWTDKLDTSKEVIIEPTTALKFSEIHFQDLPDKDFMNKFVADFFASSNPHGRFDRLYNINTYNTGGTLKNEPIFSPYIVEETPINVDSSFVNNSARRLLLHRTYSYDDNGNLSYPATQPKLFYYGGSPVQLNEPANTTFNIYLHYTNSAGATVPVGFNEYPLCSAFDVDADNTVDAGTTQISSSTKALRWDNSFIFGGANVPFNYNEEIRNTFFEMYWSNYISQLYHPDTRLLVAYFMLNEVDIAQFKFNDSIFIKDSYWRVVSIENYQAGAGASVKVTLIKIVDKLTQLNDYAGCNYYPTGNTLSPLFPVVYWTDENGFKR